MGAHRRPPTQRSAGPAPASTNLWGLAAAEVEVESVVDNRGASLAGTTCHRSPPTNPDPGFGHSSGPLPRPWANLRHRHEHRVLRELEAVMELDRDISAPVATEPAGSKTAYPSASLRAPRAWALSGR